MKRYPGIRPFRTDEQRLFFGRDTDTERLLRLIELQQVVILYGKSGYGKSSLLSAGVFPRLQSEGKFQLWEIRFGPCKPGESLPPAETLRMAVARRAGDRAILPAGLAEPGLWQTLKNLQTPENKRFLLVFDQFEELFSYPPEQLLAFKKQLAEALFSIVPKRYEKAIAEASLPPETEDALYTPFELKVVFSIRADRMSLLNGLKDYLPNLLQHSYELEALDEAAAKEAVLRPANLTDVAFDTPPFGYTPDALNAIFTRLRDERGRIETSTLQIVCKHVEDNIVQAWTSAGRRAGLKAVYGIDSVGRTQEEEWEVSFDSLANGFRLPTEVEWEYAARAGTEFEFAGDSLLENMGWFDANSGNRSRAAAQRKPNGFGLCDMSGNVWEWCADTWHDNYSDAPADGSAWTSGGGQNSAVLRGGSWGDYDYVCRVATRDRSLRNLRYDFNGFRVARAAGRE